MSAANTNARLEAFCDGVFAIAMTLLIIDITPPPTNDIASTSDLWLALMDLGPSVVAFVLSFAVILITWVNHHAALKLVSRSSASFIYANGFMLLTVVFIPFPTSLLGEFILTDHAAPAVVLYDAVLAVQALGWVLVSGAALGNGLTADESSTLMMRESRRNGYVAFVLYGLLAMVAFLYPLVALTITIVSWAFWLLLGIRLKRA